MNDLSSSILQIRGQFCVVDRRGNPVCEAVAILNELGYKLRPVPLSKDVYDLLAFRVSKRHDHRVLCVPFYCFGQILPSKVTLPIRPGSVDKQRAKVFED